MRSNDTGRETNRTVHTLRNTPLEERGGHLGKLLGDLTAIKGNTVPWRAEEIYNRLFRAGGGPPGTVK